LEAGREVEVQVEVQGGGWRRGRMLEVGGGRRRLRSRLRLRGEVGGGKFEVRGRSLIAEG
jgi:hypothetical protein